MSTDVRSKIAEKVRQRGAASVARTLEVSRGALLAYVSGTSRAATTVVVEQRAARLEPAYVLEGTAQR